MNEKQRVVLASISAPAIVVVLAAYFIAALFLFSRPCAEPAPCPAVPVCEDCAPCPRCPEVVPCLTCPPCGGDEYKVEQEILDWETYESRVYFYKFDEETGKWHLVWFKDKMIDGSF